MTGRCQFPLIVGQVGIQGWGGSREIHVDDVIAPLETGQDTDIPGADKIGSCVTKMR